MPTLSAVLPFLFLSFFNKKNRYFTSQYQEKFALYSSKLSDTIDSIREIKLFDIYKKETDKIDSEVKDLVEINTRMAFWGYTSGQFSVALQHIVIGILLGFLGYQLQQKIITLGQAVFICSISTHLFSIVGDFWSLYFSTKNSDVPWKRIKRILLRESEKKDFKDNSVKKINSIAFLNVSVEKDGRSILRNFDLEIISNDKIVLIGNTGVGKTTILNLIVLFDNISSGKILINNKDLYSIDIKNFRYKISYFTQDSFLFNTTIRENVLLNLDCNNLVNQKYLEIKKICKLENLNDKKVVGNKGIFVSGGERQRIALARCLMKNFEVLLLDEFGNSVHENMEMEIYKNLLNFYKDKIIVAVSHRTNISNLFDKKIQL
ncbi:hypothetical protein AGMMS49950_05740 [Endomicrobiia bacterium]|nr:hypothetical protein AGMMS49950_05740 [Endomicrobiia bacterium]